ncbi:MAG: PQQ-binding-like beta-propeller repeat protein [Actinomycetota bacterium]
MTNTPPMLARRLILAVVLASSLLAGLAPTSSAAPLCVRVPTVDDHCEQWVATYDHVPGHARGGIDMPYDSQMSGDGSLVFVTGQSWHEEDDAYDYATQAYEVATGAVRWSARWASAEGGHDIPYDLALSPDGKTLFVHGSQHMNPVGEGADYATVAYDAATGELKWASGYDGAPDDTGYGVAVSPDGDYVYVTGKSGVNYENVDYATVAYHADTGEMAWSSRWSLTPGEGEDIGIQVAATDDAVFVAGAGGGKIMTLAYRTGDPDVDPAAGSLIWQSQPLNGYGYYIALSPDGRTVYTTGSAHVGISDIPLFPDWSFTTVAYDAATGARKWQGLWAAPQKGLDVPYGHALSPDGSALYVAGISRGTMELDNEGTTVAFDTSNGSVRWVAKHSLPGSLFDFSLAPVVSPDGSRVYVAGSTAVAQGQFHSQTVTVAYDTTDGSQEWIARYPFDESSPLRMAGKYEHSIAMTPDGRHLVVAGGTAQSVDTTDPANQDPSYNSMDYLLLSYET